MLTYFINLLFYKDPMIKKRKDIIKYCQSVLNKIPDINAGGCLIAAYATFKYIEKHHPELFDKRICIVQYSRYIDDHVNNRMFIANQESKAVSASHFGISINGGRHAYDSRGKDTVSLVQYTLVIPHDKTKEFFNSAIKDGMWNPQFNRKKYLPIIEKKLKIKI